MLPPSLQALHHRFVECKSENAETCNFNRLFGSPVSSASNPNEAKDPKSFSIENARLSGFWSGWILRFDPDSKPRRCGFDPCFDREKHEPGGPSTSDWDRCLGSEPKDGGTRLDRYLPK